MTCLCFRSNSDNTRAVDARAPTREQVKHDSTSERMGDGDDGFDAAAAASPRRFNPVAMPGGDARQLKEADIQNRGVQLLKAATAMKNFNPSSKDGSDWKRFETEFTGMSTSSGQTSSRR